MDTRSSERDLDRPSEKGRVAGDRRHQESPDREAPIGELEAIGISGILGTSDLCTSKVRSLSFCLSGPDESVNANEEGG
jgi:hypothetical protein